MAFQGNWQIFWVAFYGFATYGNAGYMREQVCKYMCPYARFQSAMFDKDTMIVSYDANVAKLVARARKTLTTRHRAWGTASIASFAFRSAPWASISARAAVRVHWLRSVHRCLQLRDGQDGVSARPDPADHQNAVTKA
jgi:hypothetical protein